MTFGSRMASPIAYGSAREILSSGMIRRPKDRTFVGTQVERAFDALPLAIQKRREQDFAAEAD
jgi:hypothetical protein